MKTLLKLIVLLLFSNMAYALNTWYVRPDGGTRYSTNATSGQCDGLGDVAYPGTGVNQHCAFNDYRYLYQDGTYTYGTSFPGWGWVIAGGDHVIVRGSIGTGVSYRIGWDTNGPYCATGPCWGQTGNQFAGPPPLPSGTSGAHTTLYGENYGSCTSQSARTQLHGGWGVGIVLNLAGTQYADVGCLDITDFSDCGKASQAVECVSSGTVLSDFASVGVQFSNATQNLTLTDVRIHGLGNTGISGPTGGGVTLTDIQILGNASSGWNADAGDGTTGVGSLLVQNFNISWNGCAEEYPIVDAIPYGDCTDDNNGGYGDGFGTATVVSPSPGWQAHFDQGIVSYNTQDGLDALHLTGTGSSMTITRVLAYSNMGQQIKVGGAQGTAINNQVVTNCNAMRQLIPGAPVVSVFTATLTTGSNLLTGVVVTSGTPTIGQFVSIQGQVGGIAIPSTITAISGTTITISGNATASGTYTLTQAYNSLLSDFCRAADTGILLTVGKGTTLTFDDNTVYSGATTGIEVECDTTAGACDSTSLIDYRNNIFLGFPSGSGPNSNPLYFTYNPFSNSGSLFAYNATYNAESGWSCPNTALGETHAVCTNPGLVDETYHAYGYGNMAPGTGSSSVAGAGTPISGITVDFFGNARANPPTMGAIEWVGTPGGSTISGHMMSSGNVQW